jgi:outer membrane autotransporter protein
VPTAFLRSARPCGPASHASLLATTSLAALLLGAPAHAGQSFTNASVATVTNPAGQATTSIVITGSTVTGAVTNAGTIAPGKATPNGTTAALFVANSTVGGGIVNSGTIDAKGGQTAAGILISGGTVSGGITNTGSINATGTLPGNAVNPGLQANGLNLVTGGVFTGAIDNGGMILSQGTALLSFTGVGIFLPTVAVNGEAITASGGSNSPTGGQITSTITNTATIGATLAVTSAFSVSGRGFASAANNANGLSVTAGGGSVTIVGATAAGGSISGGITNAGTITASLSHMAALTATAVSAARSNASATGLIATASGGVANASMTAAGGGSINGNITNSGSIMVSAAGDTTVTAPANSVTSASTSVFGLFVSANGGSSPVSATQAVARGGNFAGNITNAGTITASVVASENGSGQNFATAGAVGFSAGGGVGRGMGGTLTSAILNSGTITATASGSGNAIGVFAPATTNIVDATGIAANANGGVSDAAGGGALVTTSITNAGLVSVSAKAVAQILPFASGISISANGGVAQSSAARSTGGVFRGGIVNNGTIVANSTSTATAANAQAITAFAGGGSATAAKSSAAGGTLIGNVVNNGMIAVSVSGTSTGSIPASGVGIIIGFGNSVEKNGGVATPGTIIGSVLNAGTIQVSASGAGERAIGITVGTATKAIVHTGVFTGAIVNSGTVSALGTSGAVGTGIAIVVPVPGGITNTGTITGNTAAIDLSQEVGGATVVNQAGGALVGSVIGSGNAKADVLNLTGGRIVLSPTQSITGFGTYTQTGGTLVLGVTQSTVAGSFASLSAGAINLRGGTLELAPQTNSLFALAAQGTTVYRNIVTADPPLSGNFASVTTPISLFRVSLSPDTTTPNSLDATLALSPSGLAASAQDLTQSLRLGLDAPQVLGQAVQDRLVASGGALGEGAAGGAGNTSAASVTPIGHPNLWVRGADQFGSASGTGAAPGYDVNRAAPLIGGVDWRFDNGIVAGIAATYVASSASFKDGSRTNVSSYQGAAYAGWAGGPWYTLGSAVVSFNDFSASRLLTPFGLPGDATSSSSGQSYAGHAEAGYHWALAAAGANVFITPYAALDYVHAHIDGFSETGGFGALSVNAADGNSFATTLGARATTRISFGDQAVLVPELRLGWSHEFLDESQTLSASLVAVSGSTFSATGINFGRDAALIGAGLSLELSSDAKVFLDYDGKLSQRLQEHSVSGGLRVRF